MNNRNFDIVVVGGGAAGFSAAVTAAFYKKRVLLIEKSHQLGGATCWSGGWAWVPRNRFAIAAGIKENISTPRRYLQNKLGDQFNAQKIDEFLTISPLMVDFFEENTFLKFDHGNGISDIHGSIEGAGTGGRSVIAKPVHGRVLGSWIHKIRPPMPETSFMGLPIMAGKDLWHFINSTKKPKSFFYTANRVTQHIWHKLRYGYTMQFANGSALIARLTKSALDLGVTIETTTEARELHVEKDEVVGVTIRSSKGDEYISVNQGVVLAAGGFAHDSERRKKLFPHLINKNDHWPLPPKEVTGDTLTMAEKIGAVISNTEVVSPAAWCPISIVPYKDGTTGHFPHIIDRAKPGTIAVLASGKRFVNEASGYHDIVDAMIKATPEGKEPMCWLIATHACQRKYGLGITKPWPFKLSTWINNGYLKKGNSLQELAKNCNIPYEALQETIKNFNQSVRNKIDNDFLRGSTDYNCKMGDPNHPYHPTLGVMETGPFYAIKMVPGSFGTFAGIRTNHRANVITAEKSPIHGLYAAGVDMESIMGGHYPTGGINLGPALTFGYIAGCELAGQDPRKLP